MGVSQFGIIIAMAAYLIGMLAIGFAVAKKNETVGDFYLGGRHRAFRYRDERGGF